MSEIWKDIPGYEGLYQVNNKGDIAALPKTWISGNGKSQTEPFRLMRLINRFGYLQVGLRKNRITKILSVHRIVAMVFVENVLNKPQVNHINGIKTDNQSDNLEWVTRSENIKHAFKIGLKSQKGERHNSAKLKEADVIEIRSKKLSRNEYAVKFNVHPSTISSVQNVINWKHI